MQCPRCGLQSGPGAARCMRCGHAFTTPAPDPAGQGGWQHPGYAARPAPAAGAQPEPGYGSGWRVLATVALSIAALACLAYGAWTVTARRAIFAELGAGRSVSFEAARESDRLHDVLLWTAVGTVAVAVVLWLLAHLRRRKPLGIAGFTAMALLVIGVLVAFGGAYLTSLVDGEIGEADTGALGFLIMGIGVLLVAGAMIAALVAAFVRPSSETPTAGFAGWQAP